MELKLKPTQSQKDQANFKPISLNHNTKAYKKDGRMVFIGDLLGKIRLHHKIPLPTGMKGEPQSDAAIIAQIVCGYVEQLEAEEKVNAGK